MKKIYLFCNAGMSTSMLASKMQSVADEHNIPIAVIDAGAYGMMDGEKVLKTAIKLIKANK